MLRDEIESKPQRLLVTIFGDYLRDIDAPIHSSTLVEFMQGFGYTENVGRVALSRIAKQGHLARLQSGRSTGYVLTDQGRRYITEGDARLKEFGSPRSWDGTWTLVAFTVQESEKHRRHLLRTALRAQGFAPLFDGLWASATLPSERARDALDEAGVSRSLIFTGASAGAGIDIVELSKKWHPETLAEAYRTFIDEFGPHLPVDAPGGREAFRVRTLAMEHWRRFPLMDVDLPDALLPPAWPRPEARRIFHELYSGLAPEARAYFLARLKEKPWDA